MVLPKGRKKRKRKNNEQSRTGPSCLVLFLPFALVATMLVIALQPSGKSPKRKTLRSLPASQRSQPSYELPMSSTSRTSPSRPSETSKAFQSDYTGTLPFPWPVPGSMRVENVLPKLLALFRENEKTNRKHGGRLVNLGAGVRDQDPTFPLLDDPKDRWEALLADGAEYQGELMAKRFPSKKIKTTVAYITADSIPGVLSQNGFDHDVDLLKIDIDSFDCRVVDSLLKTVRPSVVVMEVNVKFPANVRFAYLPGFVTKNESGDSSTPPDQYPFDSEKREHIYGCSLAYQVHDLMRPNDYEILYLESNNAVYYDKRKDVPGLNDKTPLSVTDLYHRGYWSRILEYAEPEILVFLQQ